MKVGDQVITNRAWPGVPKGTSGYIVDDYGSGITVAWDLPEMPYPKYKSPKEVAEMFAVNPNCPLCDGFDKETELQFLELKKKG